MMRRFRRGRFLSRPDPDSYRDRDSFEMTLTQNYSKALHPHILMNHSSKKALPGIRPKGTRVHRGKAVAPAVPGV
jgi:hypothetical protein